MTTKMTVIWPPISTKLLIELRDGQVFGVLKRHDVAFYNFRLKAWVVPDVDALLTGDDSFEILLDREALMQAAAKVDKNA